MKRRTLPSNKSRQSTRKQLNRASAACLSVEPLEDRILLTTPGWAFQIGGGGTDRVRDLEIGPDESVYVGGYFAGTVDFDPGPGTFNLTSLGGADGFIAKYTPGQQLVWARQVSGADADERIKAIDFDAAGNVYVLGRSDSSSGDFGSFTVTSPEGSNTFAAKLDSAGNVLWAHNLGASGGAFAVDDTGNSYIGGGFEATVDFDPGPGEFQLISEGDKDGFLLQLDTAGNFASVMSVGGSESDNIQSLAIDGNGTVYAAGNFVGTAQFGTSDGTTPVSLTSAGASDHFLLKVGADGNTNWIRQVTATGTSTVADVGFDGLGGIYLTGHFFDTINLGVNPSLVSAGDRDGYVAKWDTDGNPQWSGQVSGPGIIVINRLSFDVQGNPYFAGGFTGVADFEFGAETVQQTSVNEGNTFVMKLDPDGIFQWVEQVEHVSFGQRPVSVDDAGNVYLASDFFIHPSILATMPTGEVFASAGQWNMFVLKLTMVPAGQGFFLCATAGCNSANDVRDFTATDPMHITLFSDVVDFNNLKKTEVKLEDANRKKITGQLTNNFDGTYTATISPSQLAGLAPGTVTVTLKIEDTARRKFQVNKEPITLNDAPPPPASPGVTVTPTSGLVTTEDGGTASFTVVLNAEPTASVTIGISSSDTTEGTVLPTSLTFTTSGGVPGGWDQPQTVTVRGVDDTLNPTLGDDAYSIVTAVALSSDLDYNGLDPADVSVTNLDNETPAGVSVTDIDPNTMSAGTSIPVVEITGSGFATGASVTLTNGTGRAPMASSIVVVNGTLITATFSAHRKAKAGDWDVVVTNTDGSSGACSACFSVGSSALAANQQFAIAAPLNEPTASSDTEPQRRSRRGARDEVFSRLDRTERAQRRARRAANTPLRRLQAVAVDRAMTDPAGHSRIARRGRR